jgi:hypothetical protein
LSKVTVSHAARRPNSRRRAALIVDLVGLDRLDQFLELVWLAAEPDFYEML